MAQSIYAELGRTLKLEGSGGAADSSFAAGVFKPALDGLSHHRRQRPHRPGIHRARQHSAAVLSADSHDDGTGQGQMSGNLARALEIPVDGRQSQTALAVARGTARLLHLAWLLLRQRVAARLGPARRPGGARPRRRNLDRRDQVVDRGFPRRPEVDGLPDALRPAVLRHHRRSAVRDFSAGHRADRGGCVRRRDRMRGARAQAACLDAQEHDAAHRARRVAAPAVADRSDRAL